MFGNPPRLSVRRVVHPLLSIGHELIGAGEKRKQFAALFGSQSYWALIRVILMGSDDCSALAPMRPHR
jgi:hypothetical protein